MTETPFRVTLPVNTPEIERLLPHRYPFLLVDRVIEFGPGKVLAGLVSRIDKAMKVSAVYDPASLDAALKECA